MGIIATLGNVVRIGPTDNPILVKNAAGALVDPATISITFKLPDGTMTTPFVPTRDSLGTYHYDYAPVVSAAMEGKHTYRIVTLNPAAAYESTIYFNPTVFT